MDEIKTTEDSFLAQFEGKSSKNMDFSKKYVFESNQETFDDSEFKLY